MGPGLSSYTPSPPFIEPVSGKPFENSGRGVLKCPVPDVTAAWETSETGAVSYVGENPVAFSMLALWNLSQALGPETSTKVIAALKDLSLCCDVVMTDADIQQTADWLDRRLRSLGVARRAGGPCLKFLERMLTELQKPTPTTGRENGTYKMWMKGFLGDFWEASEPNVETSTILRALVCILLDKATVWTGCNAKDLENRVYDDVEKAVDAFAGTAGMKLGTMSTQQLSERLNQVYDGHFKCKHIVESFDLIQKYLPELKRHQQEHVNKFYGSDESSGDL